MLILHFFRLKWVRLILSWTTSYLLGVKGICGLSLIPVILLQQFDNLVQILDVEHRL